MCPGSMQYAVIRIDTVAMVDHFQDSESAVIEAAKAQAMHAKKYLVYLDHVSPILYR